MCFQVLKRTKAGEYSGPKKDRDTSPVCFGSDYLGVTVRLSTWKKTGLGTQKRVEKEKKEIISVKVSSKFTTELSS